jgi:glucose/arabinose dehydrogenase
VSAHPTPKQASRLGRREPRASTPAIHRATLHSSRPEVRRRRGRAAASLAAGALLGVLACSDSNGGTGPGETELALAQVAGGLDAPTFLTAPSGDDRLFVTELEGRIRIIENGQLRSTPFLDISSNVHVGGERGFLGLAFHPDYGTNGYFYVFYTDVAGNNKVERYTVSGTDPNVADPTSAKTIISVNVPRDQRAGGLATFGPDGLLYVGFGDGGIATNSQKPADILGKILRIDVDAGDPYAIPAGNPYTGQPGVCAPECPEIWAFGLRQPYRFSFDQATGNLFIGEVGGAEFEEVDVVEAAEVGVNFGWNVMQGTECHNATTCDQTGLRLPALQYPRPTDDCAAVLGGYVYRGSAIPALRGHYVYSDFCGGWLRSFRYDPATNSATEQKTWDIGDQENVYSLGEDAAGELYMLTVDGDVKRITRR